MTMTNRVGRNGTVLNQVLPPRVSTSTSSTAAAAFENPLVPGAILLAECLPRQ